MAACGAVGRMLRPSAQRTVKAVRAANINAQQGAGTSQSHSMLEQYGCLIVTGEVQILTFLSSSCGIHGLVRSLALC